MDWDKDCIKEMRNETRFKSGGMRFGGRRGLDLSFLDK